MRLSRFALFLLRFYAIATAFALILGWPLAAAAIGGAGLVNFAVMAIRLGGFARLMQRIVEAVARPAGLIPVAPLARRATRPTRRSRRAAPGRPDGAGRRDRGNRRDAEAAPALSAPLSRAGRLGAWRRCF